MVHQERQASHWHNKKFHTESVMITVICSTELHVDQVHGCTGGGDEYHLQQKDITLKKKNVTGYSGVITSGHIAPVIQQMDNNRGLMNHPMMYLINNI